MKKKIAVGLLIICLLGSIGLNMFLGVAYFNEFDLSAAMTRQYLSEAEEDIETLTQLSAVISENSSSTNALQLISNSIAIHQKRIDIGLSGKGFRDK